jgi:aminoglycoside phosphotransferase family enzyme/predicted kinase
MQVESSAMITAKQDDLYQMITALGKSASFDHPVDRFEIVETHISCLLLTGPCVYKFKKPLNLGFLDFSTLEKRKRCCEEEVRLNRRLAPGLYLAVVSITGNARAPQINGDGPVIEYAVKMVQFDRNCELDKLIARDELTAELIDKLAATIALFHGHADVARQDNHFGTPEHILQPVTDNLSEIKTLLVHDRQYSKQMFAIKKWSEEMFEKLKPHFAKRKEQGFIRECHGDMHLGNMVLIENEPVIFDCIEFSEPLRWSDVMSDIAFLVMDLHYHDRPDLAYRFLNAWLQETGDYEGLKGLRFFMVYRALVRAKVACIRLGQENNNEQEKKEYHRHIDTAESFIQAASPVLFITHGLSGSGKTTISQSLLEEPGAIRIRSDLERKRLQNLPPTAKTGSTINAGLYSADNTDQTYARLEELAALILEAGYSVIVDATFLQASARRDFRQVAENCKVPFMILDCQASDKVLADRIQKRRQSNTDASEADLKVLQNQLRTRQALDKEEHQYCVTIETDKKVDFNVLRSAIDKKIRNESKYPGKL